MLVDHNSFSLVHHFSQEKEREAKRKLYKKNTFENLHIREQFLPSYHLM